MALDRGNTVYTPNWHYILSQSSDKPMRPNDMQFKHFLLCLLVCDITHNIVSATYVEVMVLNLSCPAVSQICSFIFLPSTSMVRILKSTPIVVMYVPEGEYREENVYKTRGWTHLVNIPLWINKVWVCLGWTKQTLYYVHHASIPLCFTLSFLLPIFSCRVIYYLKCKGDSW